MTKGRRPDFVMSDDHRLKIKNANILTDLIKFFKGQKKLEPLRVHVGLSLLKKVMPDLQQIDVTAEHTHTVTAVRYLTEQEWLTKKESRTLTIAPDDNSSRSTPEQNGSQLPCVIGEQGKH